MGKIEQFGKKKGKIKIHNLSKISKLSPSFYLIRVLRLRLDKNSKNSSKP